MSKRYEKISGRREFLTRAAAGMAAAAASPLLRAADPKSRVISVTRRDETILRYGGWGDIFPLTWMTTDQQFSSFSDGFGWSMTPKGEYNTHGFLVAGGPHGASFHEMTGYPEGLPLREGTKDPRYYGFSALAVGSRLYHFLSCAQEPSSEDGWGWNGVKLIYSEDNGRTWHNQDGSTPVVWEAYSERSVKTLLFYEEPHQAFPLISLLQMGQNYAANNDGYVYGYGTNGITDGTMNQLVMFRVAQGQILNRRSYEFFAGIQPSGNAIWATDIGARVVVHTFPRGWVNTPIHGENVVQAWVPSVVYNSPLKLYMMANCGVGSGPDGDWFGKPSYLGLWVAHHPWGPWTQVHEEASWTPGGDANARCYSPQIAPKWVAADGKSLWLVWSDFQVREAEALKRVWKKALSEPKQSAIDWARVVKQSRQSQPYYAFNVQRFDLTVD